MANEIWTNTQISSSFHYDLLYSHNAHEMVIILRYTFAIHLTFINLHVTGNRFLVKYLQKRSLSMKKFAFDAAMYRTTLSFVMLANDLPTEDAIHPRIK